MKITVIGGGNMGGAIAAGAIKADIVKAGDVTISHLEPKCHDLFGEFLSQIKIEDDNAKSIEGADLVIVAVKPWMMSEVLGEIVDKIDRTKQALVSIAAGVTFEVLHEMMKCEELGKLGMYRIIPNTAIAIAQSTSFICKTNTSETQDAQLLSIFNALGASFIITEDQMTPLTSLSSCGIAFAYKYIDASIEGGVELGIDVELARDVVLQTVRGALMMLETNSTMPQPEIDKVTTKGGITEKGLKAMAENGFAEAVKSGLVASK
ncbi:MAG: pyrroline-5-carboxylate reductase dimerization domain-containing protein [Rikenellaceae bacterium]